MAGHSGDAPAVLRRAEAELDSVVDLTRQLVRVPTRGGIDPYQPAVDLLLTWACHRRLQLQPLFNADGDIVAVTTSIHGAHPGPTWVLDACLDTAPFGDEQAWTHPPTSAQIHDGWLWGRGSADSKAAVAIFSHIAAHLAGRAEDLHGTLVVLFDLDEHTGAFGGAKRFFEGTEAPRDIAGVMIGYPGLDHLVVGGRGVHRTRLRVRGVSSHSGSTGGTPNAIDKAAEFVRALAAENPTGATSDFPLPSKVTVTAIEGGQGYSVTPDLCTLNVDIRTTPAFTAEDAAELIERIVRAVDGEWPDTVATDTEPTMNWPPYALPEDARLRTALIEATSEVGLVVKPKIAGPSNIGNYLAGLSIPATAGFGVTYQGLHATDERVKIDTIPIVQASYQLAIESLLITTAPDRSRNQP